MKIFSTLLLSAVLVFFGWLVARISEATFSQHQAKSFPHIAGTVVSTDITTTHGSRGGTYYHAHIRYRYTVNGIDYLGYRYRYDGHPTDQNSVNAIVAAHPKDSAVDVYYNPEDPRDAVLSPGVDGRDVGLPLFMVTFLLFLFYSFTTAFQESFLGRARVAGGVKIISEMMTTRVRLPRYQPLALGMAAAGGVALVAALLISTSVLSPPWEAGEGALCAVLLGGAAVYLWHWSKVNSGRQDLVIDEAVRTLQLPLTFKRREQKPVPFTEIRSVSLKPWRQRRGRGYYSYMVTLERTDGSGEKLVDLNQERAEAFANWLREKLGVAATSMETTEEGSAG